MRGNKLVRPLIGVLWPLLFNSYVSKLLIHQTELQIILCADSFTIVATGRDVQVFEESYRATS